MTRSLSFAATLAAVLVIAGCGDSSRDMPDMDVDGMTLEAGDEPVLPEGEAVLPSSEDIGHCRSVGESDDGVTFDCRPRSSSCENPNLNDFPRALAQYREDAAPVNLGAPVAHVCDGSTFGYFVPKR